MVDSLFSDKKTQKKKNNSFLLIINCKIRKEAPKVWVCLLLKRRRSKLMGRKCAVDSWVFSSQQSSLATTVMHQMVQSLIFDTWAWAARGSGLFPQQLAFPFNLGLDLATPSGSPFEQFGWVVKTWTGELSYALSDYLLDDGRTHRFVESSNKPAGSLQLRQKLLAIVWFYHANNDGRQGSFE